VKGCEETYPQSLDSHAPTMIASSALHSWRHHADCGPLRSTILRVQYSQGLNPKPNPTNHNPSNVDILTLTLNLTLLTLNLSLLTLTLS